MFPDASGRDEWLAASSFLLASVRYEITATYPNLIQGQGIVQVKVDRTSFFIRNDRLSAATCPALELSLLDFAITPAENPPKPVS